MQPRKINIEVDPDPLTFMTSKSSYNRPNKLITIKNNGDVELDVCVFLPSHNNKMLNYPKYKPQYSTLHGFGINDGQCKDA